MHYCTTGYGQLLHQSPCTPDDIAKYKGETQAEAETKLEHDYDAANQYIQSRIPSASDGQKHVFIDQIFNMGVGTPGAQHGMINHSAWKDFVGGNNDAVPADILSLNAGGAGIHPRRLGEVGMFLNDTIPTACYPDSDRRRKK